MPVRQNPRWTPDLSLSRCCTIPESCGDGDQSEDTETDRLAREVARLTGKSLTEAIRNALQERLERERRKHRPGERVIEELNAIALHCAALPDHDIRSADEIIGHNLQEVTALHPRIAGLQSLGRAHRRFVHDTRRRRRLKAADGAISIMTRRVGEEGSC